MHFNSAEENVKWIVYNSHSKYNVASPAICELNNFFCKIAITEVSYL